MTDHLTTTWYTAVTFGPRGSVPRGPWRSREEVRDALQRWQDRTDGTFSRAAASLPETVRVNAYVTRAQARAGTVSDVPGETCVSSEPASDYTRSAVSW